MKAVFRISRQEEQSMFNKRYLIEKRIFGIFYPLVYVNGYQDCLQAISNYCSCSHIYNEVKVLYVNGVNPVMHFKFDKRTIKTLCTVNIASLCSPTILSKIDNLKIYLLEWFINDKYEKDY